MRDIDLNNLTRKDLIDHDTIAKAFKKCLMGVLRREKVQGAERVRRATPPEIKWGFICAVGTQFYLSNTEWTDDMANRNIWKPIEYFV